MPGHHTALPWREAVAVAARVATPLPAEDVPLAEAPGRVLAVPVAARADLPGTDTAAMDGYAVAGPGPWTVTARVLAGGAPWPGRLGPGQAVEIMTGAPVPAGAVAVVPYEHTTVTPGGAVSGPIGQRAHIRRAGEDARAGDEMLPAGRLVTAAVAGLLAQAGADVVRVRGRPRVRLLVTGDEVIAAGVPAPGQVRDVFGPMAPALVTAAGGVLHDRRLLRDDPGVLTDALLAPDAEVVAVSGSSSAGRADHLRTVLDKIGGRPLVDQVACRPGHPQLLASLPGGRWLVGLPGNPFAGLVAGMTLLRPLLRGLTGLAPARPWRLAVHGDVRPAPGITRLVPVTLDGDRAVVVPGARPASLSGAGLADALAVLEESWAPGDPADVLPW
ncbi:molybdopterin molybdotransferase MoeA [Couchioplanes caeruleus]|uniref:molybdopterin molybdotransferase MoeA n=1 Tax=Couchioplanes caeruleus TaxID=56438 RepID=UPI0020BFBB0C|nr:molybdopterin molybdotransferase MoeA [Couchioplanes caeruleus]UQU61676.1 molybdopterin molybdotransferase MoeA [Couchioplanes caeruleus]